MATPHEIFRSALDDVGWTVLESAPLATSGGPNPTRVHVRRGRRQLRFLVYAWKITGEGKGRRKAGRTDLDYRVQTTRTHEGDLLAEAGYLTVGLGWDEDRGVFAAFDPWVKRTTGRSSSVHISRDLLDQAVAADWVESDRADGPEAAFSPREVSRFLGWAIGLQQRRLLAIAPTTWELLDEDHCQVETVGPGARDATWLRPGDHLVLVSGRTLLHAGLWHVEGIVTSRLQAPSSGVQVPRLQLRCRRIGVVRDADRLLAEVG